MKILSCLIVFFAVFGLIGVRILEDQIFYDPFFNYFHIANKHAHFPDFEWFKLIINYVLRF